MSKIRYISGKGEDDHLALVLNTSDSCVNISIDSFTGTEEFNRSSYEVSLDEQIKLHNELSLNIKKWRKHTGDLKAFDLQSALNGAKVRTRDGRTVTNVKVICDDVIFDDGVQSEYTQGLTAEIHNACGVCTYPFYHNGGAHKYLGQNDADLFMV